MAMKGDWNSGASYVEAIPKKKRQGKEQEKKGYQTWYH